MTHQLYFLLALFHSINQSILKFSITTKRQPKSSTRSYFLRFHSLPLNSATCSFSLQGVSDCVQTNGNGGVHPRNPKTASSSNESLTMTEHQVAKLMEEDMGSAMQYLQGKGLCLMPISLATAISTATCHTRNPLINAANNNNINGSSNPITASNGDGPSSPGMSVNSIVKDANSASKS